ncbi:MAG: hypothetical protein FGM62_04000 [Methylobacterium sp.]|nr:hypothetical protein [Methylobacterium sp.]
MLIRILLAGFLCLPLAALAEPKTAEEPSVEDNIRTMDRDRDGMVSVTEIRAYLESRHGKGYEKQLMDSMEARGGPSCSSPFSRSFY